MWGEHMPVKIVSKPCKRCGVMMVDVPHTQWYCPDCVKAKDRERHADRKGKIHSAVKDTPKDTAARAEESHKAITEVNERAAAAGLSYGHMVALERTQKNKQEDAGMTQETEKATPETVTAQSDAAEYPKLVRRMKPVMRITKKINWALCEQFEEGSTFGETAKRLAQAAEDEDILSKDAFLAIAAMKETTADGIDYAAIVKKLVEDEDAEAAGEWND